MRDAAAAGQDASKFYNEHTYEEFHILVISTLFKFRKALSDLRHSRDNRDDSTKQIGLARQVYIRAYLLWRIVYSKTFSRYITGLGNVLPMPDTGWNKVVVEY